MEYQLYVVVTLFIFLMMDVFIYINSIKKDSNSSIHKVFSRFSLTVALQQAFAVLTQLSDPAFNQFGNWFTYFAYCGALVSMTAAAFYCYRYLRMTIPGHEECPKIITFFQFLPVIIICIACFLSPVTHWVFYVDEGGAYQRGSLFLLQMVCPYIYIVMSLSLSFSKKKNEKATQIRKMFRFFMLYMIPSIVGVCIQMYIVQGGYSAIGVSIGLLFMYLNIYMEDINENKRLQSIEPLNKMLKKANEEQEKRLNEISQLNKMLEDRMSVIQSMSRVYFVSFYANILDDSFTEISNSNFVRLYIGSNGSASQALDFFCRHMVQPRFTDQLLEFVDFSTLSQRMANKEFITFDYLGKVAGWCQLYFIAGDRNPDGTLKTVFLAARTIHDEKAREFEQNKELNSARLAAEAASAAKTVFLNNMSHDIRTPLNAILGFSDLMAKEKDNPEVVADYLNKIKTSGEYLLSIINNVLDMARIESGKVSVENSFMDLLEAAENTRSYVGKLAESSNHTFTIENTIKHRYVMIDGAKYQQIMMNLISNALKYTPANGWVHLQLDELDCDEPGFGIYRMTVSDNGIGMSQSFIEHIFDSFSRERNTTDSKVIGTGLGMSIVKKLVDLLGASIEIESEKDKGSKFIVTYKLELVDNPACYIEKTKPEVESTAKLSGKRILYAEDNELNAEIAISILEDAGLVVDHAENGKLCLEMFANSPAGYYSLILMDIQMPVMNGYEATKEIRKLPNGKEMPIIALSANAFAEDKAASLKAGMNNHIAKPINAGELFATLTQYIA